MQSAMYVEKDRVEERKTCSLFLIVYKIEVQRKAEFLKLQYISFVHENATTLQVAFLLLASLFFPSSVFYLLLV